MEKSIPDAEQTPLIHWALAKDRRLTEDYLLSGLERAYEQQKKADRESRAKKKRGRLDNISLAAVRRVFLALLTFVGDHSNRVWPSQLEIAETAGVSRSTVQRVMGWFQITRYLRLLKGDEKHAGPGPHRYEGEKSGKVDTNVYELSGFIALLPEKIRAMWRAAVAKVREAIQKLREFFEGALGIPEALPEAGGDGVPERLSAPFKASPKPADAPASPPPPVLIATPGQKYTKSPKPPGVQGEDRPNLAKKPGPVAGGRGIPGVRNESRENEKRGKQTAAEERAYKALRKWGVKPRQARRIVAEKGAHWVYEWTLCALWKKKKGQPIRSPGWFYSAAFQEKDGRVGWDLEDDFEEYLDREKAIAARIVYAPTLPDDDIPISDPASEERRKDVTPAPTVAAHDAEAQKVVTAPKREALGEDEVQALLSAMEEGEREAIQEQAYQEVMATANVPAVRERIERRRYEHKQVLRRIGEIIQEKKGGDPRG